MGVFDEIHQEAQGGGNVFDQIHSERTSKLEPFADYQPMSLSEKAIMAAKQIGSAIDPRGLIDAGGTVLEFIKNPNEWARKHFDPSKAKMAPGTSDPVNEGTAGLLGPMAAETVIGGARPLAKSVKSAAGGVVDAFRGPGGAQIATGGLEMGGGVLATVTGHPIIGLPAVARGGWDIREGVAARKIASARAKAIATSDLRPVEAIPGTSESALSALPESGVSGKAISHEAGSGDLRDVPASKDVHNPAPRKGDAGYAPSVRQSEVSPDFAPRKSAASVDANGDAISDTNSGKTGNSAKNEALQSGNREVVHGQGASQHGSTVKPWVMTEDDPIFKTLGPERQAMYRRYWDAGSPGGEGPWKMQAVEQMANPQEIAKMPPAEAKAALEAPKRGKGITQAMKDSQKLIDKLAEWGFTPAEAKQIGLAKLKTDYMSADEMAKGHKSWNRLADEAGVPADLNPVQFMRVWTGLAKKLAGPIKTRTELMNELKASLPQEAVQ